MTLPEVTTAFTSLKTATEILKAIMALNKNAAINEKIIDLQQIILSLQASASDFHTKYQELVKAKDDIEKKLMDYQNWEVIKSQYKLVQMTSGVFIYVPNENHPSPKPNHYLCTNCYEKMRKSLLQIKKLYGTGYGEYFCPECRMGIEFNADSFKE
ncbi:MAG: hypothetical protein CV087_23470 [Candidatus Brocadia sp. WS118]|nr:MAG: hypothetical protein CV087_23470 [Candidatus Brocadia sp. WS118]